MSDYGRCSECNMELTYRDQHHGPPAICEGCFVLEMNDDYDRYPNDYKYLPLQKLWQKKETTS